MSMLVNARQIAIRYGITILNTRVIKMMRRGLMEMMEILIMDWVKVMIG